MKKFIFLSIFLSLIFWGCSSSKRFLKHQYKFNDSSLRNILVEFRQDSTFLLRNSVSVKINFSFIGKWDKCSDHKFILLNPFFDVNDYNVKNNAPKTGDKIDSKKASGDPSYIFPIITADTIIFSKKYQGFLLKGYEFNIYRKIKD